MRRPDPSALRRDDPADDREATDHEPETGDGTEVAHRRHTRWPGWIWAIPIAALGFCVWLGARTLIYGGPTVEVHFADASGVTTGADVRYHGLSVGSVTSVGLGEDLQGVDLRLNLDSGMKGHAGPGTKFWIVHPSITSGHVKSLISGPYVAMLPADGKAPKSFTGLDEPPVDTGGAGRSFVLTADEAGKISAGAPVRYRGVKVGEVTAVRLAEGDSGVTIHMKVDPAHAGLVHRATAFWSAGGISVSTSDGISLDLPALSSLGTGAIAFETPAALAGPVAKAGTSFRLFGDRASAEAADTGANVAFELRLDGGVDGLSRGAPVTLDGRRVGRVADVSLAEGNGDGTALETPVRIELDASKLGIDVSQVSDRAGLERQMTAGIATLVQNGLRAKVSRGGILSGKSVQLVMSGKPGKASLDTGGPVPVIPNAPAPPGGGY